MPSGWPRIGVAGTGVAHGRLEIQVQRLGHGPLSVGELAREFPMTLPSFMKHVRVLESHGLIRTAKSGRVRTCVLDRERLGLIDGWLAEQRRIWEGRTDRLEHLVTDPEEYQQ